MASPVLFLLIATLLPLAGFALLLSIGKRLGSPLAGWVGSSFAIGSFACTLAAMIYWYYGAHGAENWGFAVRPIVRSIAWLPGGPHYGPLGIGVYIDSLTIAMFAMATLVAAVVHIYCVGYFRREADSARFFASLGLASFSMLGMVLSGTLLEVLAFWGLIGLSTYLLVGFRFDAGASRAALRTFIINGVGDCALLIGFGLLFSRVGNASLPVLWATLGDAAAGHAVVLPDGSSLPITFLTLAGLCLFFGAAIRAAQFPLQLWLSNTADGTPPAMALITTVTTTAAGVYLVGRLFPILTPDARLFIAIIGLTTLTMAALISLVQRDLPRLLAWITVSQLGYMMLAMGVGSWIGGLFHLIMHAFVMATLFLAAGSVIAANNGQRDMLKLTGGWRQLPMTAGVFAVAVFAMAGTPFLSKYYSQSIIATDAAAFAIYATGAGGRAWGYWLFFALPTAGAYLTAFSMARCWMFTFDRKPNLAEPTVKVREHPALWVPTLVLMIPAIVAGYAMNVPELLQRSMIETTTFCDELRAPASDQNHFTAFDQTWPTVQPPVALPDAADFVEPAAVAPSRAADALDRGHSLQRKWLLWAWLVGIILAVALYWRGTALASAFTRHPPLRWIHAWLDNEMYFPELYDWTVVRLALGLSAVCTAFDYYVLDGTLRGAIWIYRRAIRKKV